MTPRPGDIARFAGLMAAVASALSIAVRSLLAVVTAGLLVAPVILDRGVWPAIVVVLLLGLVLSLTAGGDLVRRVAELEQVHTDRRNHTQLRRLHNDFSGLATEFAGGEWTAPAFADLCRRAEAAWARLHELDADTLERLGESVAGGLDLPQTSATLARRFGAVADALSHELGL